MTITHVPLILATKLKDANTLLCPQINLMTTMHAPKIPVPYAMESNTCQSLVITETNAPSDLAIPLKDAYIPQKFVMTTTHAPPILAPTDNVFSLQLFANKETAKPFLAIRALENASMLMSTVTTTMHAL
jgi:hypothetical protein